MGRLRTIHAGCLALVLAVASPAPLWAAELTESERASIRELQGLALNALEAGNFKSARELASQVLELDDGTATLPARFALVEALLGLKELHAGIKAAEALLEMRLFESDKAKAEDLKDRLTTALEKARARTAAREEARQRKAARGRQPKGKKKASAAGSAAPLSSTALQDRGLGASLVIGGAIPAVLGGVLVGADLRWAAEGADSGGWAAIGIPTLVGGIALEVVGGILIDRSRRSTAQARNTAPQVVFLLSPGPVFGVHGRF